MAMRTPSGIPEARRQRRRRPQGTPVHIIQSRLGHSSPGVALKYYIRARANFPKEAAGRLAEHLLADRPGAEKSKGIGIVQLLRLIDWSVFHGNEHLVRLWRIRFGDVHELHHLCGHSMLEI